VRGGAASLGQRGGAHAEIDGEADGEHDVVLTQGRDESVRGARPSRRAPASAPYPATRAVGPTAANPVLSGACPALS
jgi:hypothetical protein